MLEKQFKTKSEIELLEIWMASPPWAKPVMPFDAERYLNHLQTAHKWLNEHGGDTRKVWPMLMSAAKAEGHPISESTARRYVNEAMRLFITFNPHSTRWTTEMLLNDTLEMAHSAKTSRKHAEYARLVREARGLIDKLDEYIREDAERIMSPIAVKAVMDASLVPGLQFGPKDRELAEEWLQKRLAEKASRAATADFEELPDDAG